MKKSYLEELEKVSLIFPAPLDIAIFNRVTEIASQNIPTIPVPKTERLAELKKEYDKVSQLLQAVERLGDVYKKNAYLYMLYQATREFESGDICQIQGDPCGDKILAQYHMFAAQKKAYQETVSKAAGKLSSFLQNMQEQLAYDLEAERKGVSGEDQVEAYLKQHCNARFLTSVILPGVQDIADAPKTAETDLVAVCDNGVYVCEVKNYGKYGQTLEVQPDGAIYKLNNWGEFLENMGSPTKQNYRHYQAVQEAMRRAGLQNIPVFSVVLIANPDVNLVNKSNFCVMNMYDFCDILNASNAPVLDIQMQQTVVAALQRQRMTERRFPLHAITPIYDELNAAVAAMMTFVPEKDRWAEEAKNNFVKWHEYVDAIWRRNHKFVHTMLLLEKMVNAVNDIKKALSFCLLFICGGGFLTSFEVPSEQVYWFLALIMSILYAIPFPRLRKEGQKFPRKMVFRNIVLYSIMLVSLVVASVIFYSTLSSDIPPFLCAL